MSALLDSLTVGGYTGEADDGVGDSSGSYYVQSSGGTNSGLMQQLATLGTGALSKYIDYDLQRRMVGNMPIPTMAGSQNQVGGYAALARTQNGQAVAQINLSAMLPLLAVAVVVYLVARG